MFHALFSSVVFFSYLKDDFVGVAENGGKSVEIPDAGDLDETARIKRVSSRSSSR